MGAPLFRPDDLLRRLGSLPPILGGRPDCRAVDAEARAYVRAWGGSGHPRLVDRADMSQYRLAELLAVAVLISGYIFWVVLNLGVTGCDASQRRVGGAEYPCPTNRMLSPGLPSRLRPRDDQSYTMLIGSFCLQTLPLAVSRSRSDSKSWSLAKYY